MTTANDPKSSSLAPDRPHDTHVLASWGHDLDTFAPADWGLIQRGRMIPAGRLHAVVDDETMCGLPVRDLYLFPDLRFEAGALGRQCPNCIAALSRPASTP